MKITDGEKLILLMLSEIYEKLDVRGEICSKFIKEVVSSNNLWALPWKFPGIPFEDQETPEIVKEVLDILEMWSFIEYSYSQLNDEDKALLETDATPFGKDPKFYGFDGNQETEYMGTASFVVNELDRFEEFTGRSFNSHCPSLDGHRRMFSVFKKVRENIFLDPISEKDLSKILMARRHPDKKMA